MRVSYRKLAWAGIHVTCVAAEACSHLISKLDLAPRREGGIFLVFFSGLRAVSSDHARMRVIGMFDVCGARALMCVCVCVCVCVTMKG